MLHKVAYSYNPNATSFIDVKYKKLHDYQNHN